jgi:hypothetical protein
MRTQQALLIRIAPHCQKYAPPRRLERPHQVLLLLGALLGRGA